jgi:murein DD-endopeptidase
MRSTVSLLVASAALVVSIIINFFRQGVKWNKVFANEKREFDRMTEGEKFIYFLLLPFNSPYGWGQENPESSDCSGAVCLALYAATGHFIRTTADDLFKRVFTVKLPMKDSINAAVCVDGAGTAGHVAGVVGDGVILNSQDGGAQIKGVEGISAWFRTKGVSTAIRGLDRAVLVRLAREGKTRYELDPELARYVDWLGLNNE